MGTLQSSGAISLNDIQTVFGGTNPIGMNEYYAGGVNVPAGTSGIPTTGTISIQQFYGKSKAVTPGTTVFTTLGSSSWTAPAGITRVDVLIVAGGGAGGYAGDRTAGGGGGGGVVYVTNQTVTPGTSYSVFVGNGGGIGAGAGENGQSSSFHIWSATGGGGGANSGSGLTSGQTGGSGGGRYHNAISSAGSGTAGQGFAGGPNAYDSGSGTGAFTASGGGGAGGIGGSGTTSGGGAGGAAVSYTIDGVTYTVGGGGGGSAQSLGGQNLPGGSGGTNAGSGATSSGSLVIGGSAVANRGGGGGGGASGQYGGGGGSGIVVIRYYTPAGRRSVNLNFYPPSSDAFSSGWSSTTNGALLMARSILWACNKTSGAVRVYFVHATPTASWVSDVQSKISNFLSSNFPSVTLTFYTDSSGAPNIGTLTKTNYDVAMVSSDATPGTSWGAQLQSFADAGGGIVLTTFANASQTITNFSYPNYTPIQANAGNQVLGSRTLNTGSIATHFITTGLSSFDAGTGNYGGNNVQLNAGATNLASYGNGTSLVAVQER